MSWSKKYLLRILNACMVVSVISCGGEKDKKETNNTPPVIFRKDTATQKKPDEVKMTPIINLTDSLAPKANIIYIKDSAATSVRLGQKLSQIYATKLQAVIKQNKLKQTGMPIAWYRSQKAPFFFEAGLPVDKKPAKLPKNILFKTIGGDSAVIAHFYGPYDQTSMAYEALSDWLKDHNKKSTRAPYEIYVTDPIDKTGKPVDPYKVQTDIIYPHN
ncbi:MAG: GyrI-like domain-containing protein [Bacteroidetes bacterium]|nr:GyrI-like domain-containing protein [Bacteroidota bacterium]